MRILVLITIFLGFVSLASAFDNNQLIQKKLAFNNANQCKICHRSQFKEWQKSWHTNNYAELYNKVVEIIAHDLKRLKIDVTIGCANCHNPTVTFSEIDKNYIYSKILGVETNSTKEADALMDIDKMSGVDCFVCHKIASIKKDQPKDVVGAKLIEWIQGDEFAGPFGNTNARYHKSRYSKLFDNSNEICAICHQGYPIKDQNGKINELAAYTTNDEASNSSKPCVHCHMSERHESVTASAGSGAQLRFARYHKFVGGHDVAQARSGFTYTLHKDKKNNLYLNINNTAPHMNPSGFLGRMVKFIVTYKDDKGNTIMGVNKRAVNYTYEIRARFLDADGLPEIQYLAQSQGDDNRLAPNGYVSLELKPPKDAHFVSVQTLYYFIDPDIVKKYDNRDKKTIEQYKSKNNAFVGQDFEREYLYNFGKLSRKTLEPIDISQTQLLVIKDAALEF